MGGRKSVTAIIIVLIIAVLGYAAYFMISGPKADESPRSASQSAQEKEDPTKAGTRTEFATDKGVYSLVRYPIGESPAYDEYSDECQSGYRSSSVLPEVRLVNGEGEVLIPSLVASIARYEGRKPLCSNVIKFLTAPAHGEYFYLIRSYLYESDRPNNGLADIYRVNMGDLSIQRLDVSNFVGGTVFQGVAESSFKVLDGGERLVKVDAANVYLVNLKDDSYEKIYTVSKPQEQWLVSEIRFGISTYADHDIDVNENEITLGLYDKTETVEGHPITHDESQNVGVETGDDDFIERIQPKHISDVVLIVDDYNKL